MVLKKKDPLDRFLDWLEAKLKDSWQRLVTYVARLLFPLYLFPVKLVTYSIYYLLLFFVKFIIGFGKLFFKSLIYPFTSVRNFLRFVLSTALIIYVALTMFVIYDYLTKQYGFAGKILCSYGVKERVERATVRVVGGQGQGTGFYIKPDSVLTSFHVIDGETSPKIILPDGKFVTVDSIRGDKTIDLALLQVPVTNPEPLDLPDTLDINADEPMMAVGYALGTDMKGSPTVLRGNYVANRHSNKDPASYIQTSINLVQGMSGGPVTDLCGNVMGVNTMGLAGLSLFVDASQAKQAIPRFTDQNVAKIKVDPSASPEEAVRAFYTYLKARRMEDGFKLLSREYLKKTDFTEWTNRFRDILDVEVVQVKKQEGTTDTAFVKFGTQNWVDNEIDVHYYEGTWQTVPEDGVYKMLRSNIKEIMDPGWQWYYE